MWETGNDGIISIILPNVREEHAQLRALALLQVDHHS